MSQKRYTKEFRQQIIELHRLGRTIPDLAREFEPHEWTIRSWVNQADIDEGRSEGLTSSEREELARLKKELRTVKQERDILAKAAAWFARETDSIPRSSS